MNNFIVFKFDRKSVFPFLLFLLVPVGIGIAVLFIAKGGYSEFARLPAALPALMYSGIWGVFYALSGVAAFLVWRATSIVNIKRLDKGLVLHLISLALCFLWPVIFFNLNMRLLAVAWLLLALLANAIMCIRYFRTDRRAGIIAAVTTAWLAYMLYCNIHLLILAA